MRHGCVQHCPRGGHRTRWLGEALLVAALLFGLYWCAARVARWVDSAMSVVALAVLAVAAAMALGLTAKLTVDRVRSRRALAKYAALEEEAWGRPGDVEVAPVAALTPAARALVQAPTVRVEAFVDREHLRDVA